METCERPFTEAALATGAKDRRAGCLIQAGAFATGAVLAKEISPLRRQHDVARFTTFRFADGDGVGISFFQQLNAGRAGSEIMLRKANGVHHGSLRRLVPPCNARSQPAHR
jgi:hypothetical protein